MLGPAREEPRDSEKRPTSDVESEHLAALSAAIRVGIDDIEAGNFDDVDDPAVWVEGVAKTVTTQSVAWVTTYLIRVSAAAISTRYHQLMARSMSSTELSNLRRAAGLSQRELAARSGVPQPNIAAYESGRRKPAADTIDRLDAALRVVDVARLRAARDSILRAAEERRLSDVRVFGSVARGTAGPGSDVDLLVHPAADASVFDLAGFMAEVHELLGVEVDVVSDRGTGPVVERIRAEAVPL